MLDLDVTYEVATFPFVSPVASALLQANASGIAIAGLVRATTFAGVGSNITDVDSRNVTWAPASVPSSALPGPLSQWAPATASDAASGSIFFAAGNVGVGTNDPAAFTLQVSGSIGSTGEMTSHFSDDRLKTRVATLTGALDKVESMTAFTYVHNDLARDYGFKDPRQRVGLSAQDVERAVPEAVSIAPFDAEIVNGRVTSRSGKNFMTVQYTAVVPVLIAALQEEAKLRRDLEARLENLEKNILLHG